MAFGTFVEKTGDDQCTRFACKVETATILDPTNASALEQGEWLEPTATGKLWKRHVGTANGPMVAFPVAAPRGSTDVQSTGKTELYQKWELADTTSYKPGLTYTVGMRLMVNSVDIGGGVMRSALTTGEAASDVDQAIVVIPPSDSTTFTPMRIKRIWHIHA